MNRVRLRDLACLSYWFPILARSGVPVPETRIVTTEAPLDNILGGEPAPGFPDFVAALRAAAGEVGGYPVFLRTGHGSGKHQWAECCYVQRPAMMGQHVANLVEWSACVDMMGLPTQVWAVRQFLPLATTFTAPGFGDFPVNRERRYFIEGGRVRCHHPYWPESAVADGRPVETNWRARLAALNEEPDDEVALLTTLSEQVAREFVGLGAWSLDWAVDTHGTWYAIDMAPAEISYHWPGCGVAL